MSVWGTTLDEIQSSAGALRVDMKVDGTGLYLPALEIVRLCGGEAHHDVPRGMHGLLELEPRLRVGHKRGSPIVETRGITHELGHLVLATGHHPDDEDDATEAGKCLLLPPDVCREMLRRYGWDPVALARAYPDVPLPWTLGRMAVTQGGVAILRQHGCGRLTYAAPGITIPPLLQRFERDYARRAAASPLRVSVDLFGIATYSMGRPGREGTVIVAPPDALARLGENIHCPEVSAYFGAPLPTRH